MSRRRGRMIIAIVSAALVLYVVVGLAVDIGNFDRTSGGYEPPYEGWTGTPTNWDAFDKTPEGFGLRGVVLDTYVNCTTGMISVRVLHLYRVNVRPLSERALKVHKPRKACYKHGFEPQF